MDEEDFSYFRKRAAQEEKLSLSARDQAAATAHRVMAEGYRDLIQKLDQGISSPSWIKQP